MQFLVNIKRQCWEAVKSVSNFKHHLTKIYHVYEVSDKNCEFKEFLCDKKIKSDLLIRWCHESCFHKSWIFFDKLASCFDLLKMDLRLRITKIYCLNNHLFLSKKSKKNLDKKQYANRQFKICELKIRKTISLNSQLLKRRTHNFGFDQNELCT